MFISFTKHNLFSLYSLFLFLLLRAERESLESGLLDRQELASMLEADRARLEGENASLQQANETLMRECLFREPLFLPRWLGCTQWPSGPSYSPQGAHILAPDWGTAEGSAEVLSRA